MAFRINLSSPCRTSAANCPDTPLYRPIFLHLSLQRKRFKIKEISAGITIGQLNGHLGNAVDEVIMSIAGHALRAMLSGPKRIQWP